MFRKFRLIWGTESGVVACSVAGWLTALAWTAVAYFVQTSKNCSALSHYNLIEAPLAWLFLTITIFLFSLSAVQAYGLVSNGSLAPISRVGKYTPIVLAGLALLVVPFNTHDISFYFGAGQAAHRGLNVFTAQWSMVDSFYCPGVNSSITGIMYGPLTVLFIEFIYFLSGAQPILFIFFWKLWMLLGMVIAGQLTFYLVRYHSIFIDQATFIDQGRFNLLWYAQPILLWHWVANGQFDVWWFIMVLAAFILAIRGQWAGVIICLLVGIWIKFIPLLMAPWFALWWWQSIGRENWKVAVTRLGAGVLGTGIITWLSWKPFWQGFVVFKATILQSKWAVNSLFAALYFTLKPLAVAALDARAHLALTSLLQGGLLLLALFMVWPLITKSLPVVLRRARWQPVDFIQAIFISMLVYLIFWQKSFWPWYISWLLPLGIILFFISAAKSLRWLTVWLSVAPLFFYIIWIFNHVWRHTDAPSELWFYYTIVVGLWLLPVMKLAVWRKKHYELSDE